MSVHIDWFSLLCFCARSVDVDQGHFVGVTDLIMDEQKLATKLTTVANIQILILILLTFRFLTWLVKFTTVRIHVLLAKFTLIGNSHSPEILASLILDTILIDTYLSFMHCAASMFCWKLIYGKDFTEDKHEIKKCKTS